MEDNWRFNFDRSIWSGARMLGIKPQSTSEWAATLARKLYEKLQEIGFEAEERTFPAFNSQEDAYWIEALLQIGPFRFSVSTITNRENEWQLQVDTTHINFMSESHEMQPELNKCKTLEDILGKLKELRNKFADTTVPEWKIRIR